MNAIDFLKKEHEKVKKTLAEISEESHRQETKLKMFSTLCSELIRHETMEHQVWYPHFKERLSKEVQHLIKEEKSAEKAIAQFSQVKDESTWEIKFEKFKKDVLHHAEEEEQELFPEVAKLLSDNELEKIGLDMHQFKQEYTEKNT